MARLALVTTEDLRDCFEPGNSLVGLVGPRLRPTSAVVYRRDLTDFLAAWPSPEEASRADLTAYLDSRAADNPAGWDRRAAGLRYFFDRGIETGLWTANPAADLPRQRRGDWRWRR
jgi:hypothetical protein